MLGVDLMALRLRVGSCSELNPLDAQLLLNLRCVKYKLTVRICVIYGLRLLSDYKTPC